MISLRLVWSLGQVIQAALAATRHLTIQLWSNSIGKFILFAIVCPSCQCVVFRLRSHIGQLPLAVNRQIAFRVVDPLELVEELGSSCTVLACSGEIG